MAESVVESVDDFGRILVAKDFSALFDSSDDLLIRSTYATPEGVHERVLNAVATRQVSNLAGTQTYASETWEYDTPSGRGGVVGTVSAGLVTGHTVSRYDLTSGNLLGNI